MFGVATDPGHVMHARVAGIILMVVGLVYVAKSWGWLNVALPDFWPVVLVLFGLLTMGCASCYAPK